MFNRSAIAKEAHRVARIFAAGSVPYRRALSLGFKQAWRHAKGVAEIERRDAVTPPCRLLSGPGATKPSSFSATPTDLPPPTTRA